jgi:ATP synthase protein I
MSNPGSRSDDQDAELKARLDKLSGAIKVEKEAVEGKREESQSASADKSLGTALGMGLRVSSELVAGVVVGAFIGWWIDRWLGSSPVAFLFMTVIGIAAGFWNVYRIAARPTGSGKK